MIQDLRRKHRLIVTTLAFALPVVFLSGLVVRRPFPVSETLAALRQDVASVADAVTLNDDHLWQGLAITTRLLRAESDSPRVILELKATSDPGAPDALVYWSAVQPEANRLPERAVLLGSLKGPQAARFRLPQMAAVTPSHLILYSLARQQVIATAALPKGDAP